LSTNRHDQYPFVPGALCGLLLLLFPGCIAIPVGEKILEEKVSKRTPREAKQLVASTLTTQHSNGDQLLCVKLDGTYRVRRWEDVVLSRRVNERKLVLGLYPGLGSRWWAGAMGKEWAVEFVIGGLFGCPLVNAVLMMAPTVGPWFAEFGRDWSPAPSIQKEVKAPNCSMVGWAKTGKVVARELTVKRGSRTSSVSEGEDGEMVRFSFPEIGFEAERQTVFDGRCVLDLARLPILTDRPLKVLITAPKMKVRPSPVSVVAPASGIGRMLAGEIRSEDFPYDKVYVRGDVIDFTVSRPSLAPLARSSVRLGGQNPDRPQELNLSVTVSNTGRGALYRLVAVTRCREEERLSGHLLVFGKIEPDQSTTRTVRLPLVGLDPRKRYEVALEFSEANGYQPTPVTVALDCSTLKWPALAWAYEVVDDKARSGTAVGNGDGVIQRGEAFDLVVAIRNNGTVPARNTRVHLQVPRDPSLQILKGDVREIAEIPPNSSKKVRFNVSVRPLSDLPELRAQVSISESSFGLQFGRLINLPFDKRIPRKPILINSTYYVAAEEAVLRTGASDKASEFGRAPKGTALHAVGALNDWLQVEIDVQEKGRRGTKRVWVARGSLTTKPPSTVGGKPIVITRFGNRPPRITFVEPTADLETTEKSVRLTISVVDVDGVLKDVRVETGPSLGGMRGVGGIKSARTKKPGGAEGDERVIRHLLHLAMGPNLIRVTATDDRGQESHRTLTITRRPKRGKTYLVAVGINNYPGDFALACARQDADLFADFARRTLVVASEDMWVLTDAEASRRNIMAAFGKVRGRAKPEDTVIIFLAGHGMIERVGAREEKYFVPADANWKDLFSSAIAMEDFRRILRLDAERVLVVADLCHSGAIKTRGPDVLLKGLAGKGRIVIGYEGPAREDRTLGHGYLTYYLVEALKGAGDANRDGKITIREACEYASDKIKKATGSGLWVKGEGDLEIVRHP